MKKWIKQIRPLVLVGLILITLSGCVSMQVMKPAEMLPPFQTDDVLVTVVRPQTFFGAAISSSIWDTDKLVGVIAGGQYVQYKTTPGKHLFVCRAENWSYLSAEFLPGKHYIIRADVFPGVWKARITLNPFNKSDEDYKETVNGWLTNLKPLKLDPLKIDEYATKRLDEVRMAVKNFRDGNVKFSTLSPDNYF